MVRGELADPAPRSRVSGYEPFEPDRFTTCTFTKVHNLFAPQVSALVGQWFGVNSLLRPEAWNDTWLLQVSRTVVSH